VTERGTPAAIAERIGVDPDTLMSVNRIPVGMRLKPGSTIVVPRGDDDDEDISADVAESAVLAVEPDVPDTRKMLIRVRRKQSMADFASRYNVSVSQVKGWNRTRRDLLMPGQLVVLHVPVGRAIPAEPGPVRLENVSVSSRTRGGVTKIGTHMPEPANNSRTRSATAARHADTKSAKGGAPKVTRVSESFPASKASSKPVKSAAVHPTQPAKKSEKKKP